MNRVKLLTIAAIMMCVTSCEKEDERPEYPCQKGDINIIGARCSDGSRSDATGQGACSSHGGVNYWICK